MTKEKEMLLDKVIAVFGHEHEKTVVYALLLEKAADTEDVIAELDKIATTIIEKELKEREEN